jgi:hypothetical protein
VSKNSLNSKNSVKKTFVKIRIQNSRPFALKKLRSSSLSSFPSVQKCRPNQMKNMIQTTTRRLAALSAILAAAALANAANQLPDNLMGHRYLTFNTVIRVNQIEVSRNKNKGKDERKAHTPEAVIAFRNAVEAGFPGARITWAFSWLALHDTSPNYRKIRELVAGYHHQYGDDVTFIPGAYFANAYNTREQVNKDLREGLAKVSEMVGNGFRPKSVLAGFLSADNQKYLAEKEGIHVCQGNIWSQYAVDNQDGDGSVSYPYYPSTEHFCKPAQGNDDFIDCVNLDGWTMDFIAARRAGRL